MLWLRPRPTDLRTGLSRRRWLQAGLGASALALGTGRSASGGAALPGFGRAKSCIFVYLFGGPSHVDIWDMKPDAPEGIRGEFKPIATNVPGLHITEHLPRLARMADKYTIVRSMTHGDAAHGSAGHTMMTGRAPRTLGEVGPTPEDFPTFGSVLTKLRPPRAARRTWPCPGRSPRARTSCPATPEDFSATGWTRSACPPPPEPMTFPLPELRSDAVIDGKRMTGRRALRDLLENGQSIDRNVATDVDTLYRRAFDLFGNPAVAEAFRIDREDPKLRDRYGMNPYGQSLILARRLAEAGVPMVTVYWPERTEREAFNNNGTIDPVAVPAWDTHGNRVGASGNFPLLKNQLLPPFDLGSSALLVLQL